jgi:hypothetical protein
METSRVNARDADEEQRRIHSLSRAAIADALIDVPPSSPTTLS